jgi:hypothetical protein
LKSIRSKKLKHCSFAGCVEITDFGFQKFTSQCPNLESLDVTGCFEITDNSIKFLAFSCKYLVNLSLKDCKMVIHILQKLN